MNDTPPTDTLHDEPNGFEVPFEPLFECLRAEGIEPTIDQMREFSRVVALEEHWTWDKLEAVAVAFFGADQARRESVRSAIEDVRRRRILTQKTEHSQSDVPSRKPPQEPHNRRRPQEAIIALTAMLIAVVGFFMFFETFDQPQYDEPPPQTESELGPQPIDRTTATRSGCSGRNCGVTGELNAEWAIGFSLSAGLGLGVIVALAYLLRCPIRPTGSSEDWVRPGGRFQIGSLGSKRSGFLGEIAADKLADLVVDRTRDRPSDRVDGLATVESTARNAGIPHIEWQTHKSQRKLLIVEDGSDPMRDLMAAGPLLRDMMERRGVQSELATASNTLEDCLFEDGAGLRVLERLADPKTASVFVMDDRVLRRSPLPLIQALFASKTAIWLDPRLTKSAFVTRTVPDGLIRAPITEEALVTAMEAVTGLVTLPVTRIDPNESQADLDPYLDLGDTLPLAFACSLLQPISIDLVDHLRRVFFRHLVPHDILRMATCEGVHASTTELRFSSTLQRRLSADFNLRFTKDERSEIGRVLLSELIKGRPSERDSFAHASWELMFRQVQLTVAPDPAIKGLARLSQTSLRPNLEQRLRDIGALGSSEFAGKSDAAGGFLDAALSRAQIGPFPLPRGLWRLLFATAAALALVPTIMIGANL